MEAPGEIGENVKIRRRWRPKAACAGRQSLKRATRKRLKRRRFQKSARLKDLRRLQRSRLPRARRPRRKYSMFTPEEAILRAPKSITLLDRPNHEALTKFLAELRLAFADEKRTVCIDFSQTKRLFPEGMLLLYAELNRLRSVFSDKDASCIPASNLVVDGVLEHLGVYAWFDHKSQAKPCGDNVVGWKVHHAELVDGSVFGPPIENLGLKTEQARRLFEGVSEAVTNVRHHAYLQQREDGLNLPIRQKWWMFIHESEKRLYVAICDLGIGIPRSLPIQHGWEMVRHALRVISGRRRRTDGRMIEAALRLRRTRTDQEHRGLGFNDMIAVLNTLPGSRMRIHSNHGVLSYNADCRPPSIQVAGFKGSILGTIIAWHFPNEGEKL